MAQASLIGSQKQDSTYLSLSKINDFFQRPEVKVISVLALATLASAAPSRPITHLSQETSLIKPEEIAQGVAAIPIIQAAGRSLLQIISPGDGQAIYPLPGSVDTGPIKSSHSLVEISSDKVWSFSEEPFIHPVTGLKTEIKCSIINPITNMVTGTFFPSGQPINQFQSYKNARGVLSQTGNVGVIFSRGDGNSAAVYFGILDQNGQEIVTPLGGFGGTTEGYLHPFITTTSSGDFIYGGVTDDTLYLKKVSGVDGSALASTQSLTIYPELDRTIDRYSSCVEQGDQTVVAAFENRPGKIMVPKFDSSLNPLTNTNLPETLTLDGSRPELEKLNDGTIVLCYIDPNGAPTKKILDATANTVTVTSTEMVASGPATGLDFVRSARGRLALAFGNVTDSFVQLFDQLGGLFHNKVKMPQGFNDTNIAFADTEVVVEGSSNGRRIAQFFRENQPVNVSAPIDPVSLFPNQTKVVDLMKPFSDSDVMAGLESMSYQVDSSYPRWSRNATHLTLSPISGDQGVHSIKVTATDGVGNTAEDTFSLDVGNRNPSFNNSAKTFANMTEGSSQSLSFASSDLDGDAITLDSSQMPFFATQVGNDQVNVAPPLGSVGNYQGLVSISDGFGGTASKDFAIQVNPVPTSTGGGNGPIIRESIPSEFVVPLGVAFELDLSQRPFFSGAVSLRLEMQPGSTLPSGFSINGVKLNGNAPSGTTLPLRLVAADGNGDTSFQDFTVRADINADPKPIVINPPLPTIHAESGSPFHWSPEGIFGLANPNPDLLTLAGTDFSIEHTKHAKPRTLWDWYANVDWLKYGQVSQVNGTDKWEFFGKPGIPDTNGLDLRLYAQNFHGNSETIKVAVPVGGMKPGHYLLTAFSLASLLFSTILWRLWVKHKRRTDPHYGLGRCMKNTSKCITCKDQTTAKAARISKNELDWNRTKDEQMMAFEEKPMSEKKFDWSSTDGVEMVNFGERQISGPSHVSTSVSSEGEYSV